MQWIAKPRPVFQAELLCFVLAGACGLGLMLSASYAIDPMDGVTRAEGLAWSAALLAGGGLFALMGLGIHAGRRWAWTTTALLGIAGLVGAVALVVAVVKTIVGWAGEPLVGAPIGLGLMVFPLTAAAIVFLLCLGVLRALPTPEARRWFGFQPAQTAVTLL